MCRKDASLWFLLISGNLNYRWIEPHGVLNWYDLRGIYFGRLTDDSTISNQSTSALKPIGLRNSMLQIVSGNWFPIYLTDRWCWFRGMDTLSGEVTVKQWVWPLLHKWSSLKERIYSQRSKFFPFREDHVSEVACCPGWVLRSGFFLFQERSHMVVIGMIW